MSKCCCAELPKISKEDETEAAWKGNNSYGSVDA